MAKSTILQLTEWTDWMGNIHIHYDELVGTGWNWVMPARVLGMDVVSFVKMLKETYDAKIVFYKSVDGKEVRFVGYTWKDLKQARAFKNYVNKIAREKGVTAADIA